MESQAVTALIRDRIAQAIALAARGWPATWANEGPLRINRRGSAGIHRNQPLPWPGSFHYDRSTWLAPNSPDLLDFQRMISAHDLPDRTISRRQLLAGGASACAIGTGRIMPDPRPGPARA